MVLTTSVILYSLLATTGVLAGAYTVKALKDLNNGAFIDYSEDTTINSDIVQGQGRDNDYWKAYEETMKNNNTAKKEENKSEEPNTEKKDNKKKIKLPIFSFISGAIAGTMSRLKNNGSLFKSLLKFALAVISMVFAIYQITKEKKEK